MLLLMVFALIAGAGTAITPCVLPVLPGLLSASAVGGRRRPFGIVLGLGITFSISIIALSQIEKGVGLGSGVTRTIAVFVLLGLGLVMMIPALAERVQAPLSRLARFGPHGRGNGFWSGVGVGAALGFVCAPCAGPILAAVIAVGNTSGATLRSVAVALSYVAGLCAVLTLYAVGGRRLLDAIRRRVGGHVVERVLGAVLVVTALAIATNVDVRFEDALAKATSCSNGNCSGVLAFLVDPTHSLENSSAVQSRLAALRPESRYAVRQREAAASANPLPNLGQAPDFTDNQDWFNTPGGRPLTIAGLRGHVVLVDFWTYTCINCIRTLPFLKALYADYHRDGLEIVGVETPEFAFEQEAGNVLQAVRADGILYPVVQDNNYGTWNAYQNNVWPAEYLIDAHGDVRDYAAGEGDYKQREAAVRALLFQAGVTHLPAPITTRIPTASAGLATNETYLGAQTYADSRQSQAQPTGFVPGLYPGVHSYPGDGSLRLDQAALKGDWKATAEYLTPAGSSDASISLDFQAAHVYLVLTSVGGTPRTVRVRLDGRSIPAFDAGSDVRAGGAVTVRGQRLYNLVSMPSDEQHVLTVQLPLGVRAYDFTFG
jgi:cytochrome c biogenesis protein CcdA/thiol-disulfide isomerase/thioredoxin